MDLKKLSEPLNITDIDFRVQSINKGGYAVILAYKDARVDMNRLDSVVGHLNWKREHTRDNKNCIVSIYDEEKKEWVSKEDTGVESNTEQEKGLASDSFKRACFNWGIGRELYDYPIIQVKLKDDEWEIVEYNGKKLPKATFKLQIKKWVWSSKFDNGKIIELSCKDENRVERWNMNSQTNPQDNNTTPQQQTTQSNNELPWLNKNDKLYPSICNALKKGERTIEQVKTAYKLSKEMKDELEKMINEAKAQSQEIKSEYQSK